MPIEGIASMVGGGAEVAMPKGLMSKAAASACASRAALANESNDELPTE